MKKTLFEKLFPYHVSQIDLLYGNDKCKTYVKEANDRLVSLIWLIGMSCFTFVMTYNISGLSSRTIAKLVTFNLLPLGIAYITAKQLKDIYKMTWGDSYLIKKWMKAALLAIGIAVASAGYNIYTFVKILDFSKQSVKLDSLGIEMTIPRRWNNFHWNLKPDSVHPMPTYSFSISHGYRQIDFTIYGRARTHETSFKDIEPVFDRVAESCLDNSSISGPEILKCDSLAVHRTIGSPNGFPERTCIYHQLIHQGSVISYVYCFYKDLYNLDKELAASLRMLKNIKLTDAIAKEPTPHTNRRSIVLKNEHPYYFVERSNGIDIRSACMDIAYPTTMASIQWNVRHQNRYEFLIHMNDGTNININLLAGQRKESPDIKEEGDAFRTHTHAMMDTEKNYIADPDIVRFRSFSGWKAIGKLSNGEREHIVACYDTWHKGSHLQISAKIPVDGRDYKTRLASVETLLENIDFY